MPSSLSGGQQQRVAIARAMSKTPGVFLFDEPLSNLDAQLRRYMRIEIARLHQRLKTTSIFVTHDQHEAMTLADRIVLLRAGAIEQVGTPREIFEKPRTRFVAGFIGSPPMNLFEIDVSGDRKFNGFAVPSNVIDLGQRSSSVVAGIRPGDLHVARSEDSRNIIEGTVELVEFLGNEALINFNYAGAEMAAIFPAAECPAGRQPVAPRVRAGPLAPFRQADWRLVVESVFLRSTRETDRAGEARTEATMGSMEDVMKKWMMGLAVAGAALAPAATNAWAEAACSSPLKILAQPRDGLTLLDQSKAEFEKLGGASFQIDYLNENDRRAKSKADAATVGTYNIYYIDEANVSLFASSKWVVPLLDYYPKEYDYQDFDPGMRKVATYNGVPYFAPMTGGGDLFVWRKSVLAKAGIKPPKTVEELKAAAKALNDPAHNMYGIALRGQRGSGANVWRWMPYFRGYGGQWFDGDKPAFDSEAAVKATQDYLELFKYSPPGTKTGNWDESTGAFLVGQHGHDHRVEPPRHHDDRSPGVQGGRRQVDFAAPPAPLTGGGYAHGFAIASKANADDAAKKCAALWIAWATSKDDEKKPPRQQPADRDHPDQQHDERRVQEDRRARPRDVASPSRRRKPRSTSGRTPTGQRSATTGASSSRS